MTKKFDRKAFKAAQLEVNKAVVSQTEAITRRESKRGDYHSIDSDKPNYFRILPPHNPNEPSCQPKVVYWLECNVERYEDGEPTGKFERKQRPIFDSRVHGGTPKDICNEYIQFARTLLNDTIQDKEELKKKLSVINGYRDKKKQWHPGILPNTSYVYYATKNGIVPENIGRLELYKTDKERLEELNVDENSDEPILVDMLSDPDDGVEVVITITTEDGKKKKLIKKREVDLKGVKGAENIGRIVEEFRESQRVSDEVLEKFSEMESLKDMFTNAYKRTDFQRALEALQYFDAENEIGVFDHDEFIDIVSEIDDYYTDDVEETEQSEMSEEGTDTDETTTEDNKTPENELDWEDSEAVEEHLNSLSRKELKDLLLEFDIKFRVVTSTKEEAIRSAIMENLFPNEETSEEGVEENVPEEPIEEQQPEKESLSANALKKQLEERRKKMQEKLGKKGDLPF